jgi:hypothetical protein
LKDDIFIETDITHTCPHSVAQVWGLSLMPLSIWHLWFLRSQDNPFVVGGSPNADDLAMAVLTCSMTRKEMGQCLDDEIKLAESVSDMVDLWLEMSKEQKAEHIKAFDEYIQAGMNAPDFWQSADLDEVKHRLRCPSEWHIVFLLLKNSICKTEEEAWNYPYARAICWRAVIGEQNGNRDYIDPVDRADLKKVNTQWQ